jgi:hypothetical protein
MAPWDHPTEARQAFNGVLPVAAAIDVVELIGLPSFGPRDRARKGGPGGARFGFCPSGFQERTNIERFKKGRPGRSVVSRLRAGEATGQADDAVAAKT